MNWHGYVILHVTEYVPSNVSSHGYQQCTIVRNVVVFPHVTQSEQTTNKADSIHNQDPTSSKANICVTLVPILQQPNNMR